MFSQVSVQGWQGGKLNYMPSPPLGIPTPVWTYRVRLDIPMPLLVTSGGHHWRPVQTCSLEALP